VKYLFIDAEFATVKDGVYRICEFGYVVSTENFEIIERNNFIINPDISNAEWDWHVVRKILTRELSEYKKSSKFSKYYNKIKQLIIEADYVFGHAVLEDVKALNCECLRYNFPSIDFEFYDIEQIYKEYSNIRISKSLSKISAELGVEGEEIKHDAEADAVNTMLNLKAILNQLEFALKDLINLCPFSKRINFDYTITIFKKPFVPSNNKMGRNSTIKRYFSKYLDYITPNSATIKIFEGQKISISSHYEAKHMKQIFNIAQMICDRGGKYTSKASECNIFVSCETLEDAQSNRRSRLRTVNNEINKGKEIKIISFEDFLELLEITEKELDEMPMVSFDFLESNKKIIKPPVEVYNQNQKQRNSSKKSKIGYNLGEVLQEFRKNLKE